MNRKERASEYFGKGYSCSQSVLASFAEDYGIDIGTALRIAGGFGGGMGRTGETCGALTGAIMVIGLKYRGSDPGPCEAKDITYEKVRKAMQQFEKHNKSTHCRELLGVDISTSEGDILAYKRGLYTDVCTKLVADAFDILEDIIN